MVVANTGISGEHDAGVGNTVMMCSIISPEGETV